MSDEIKQENASSSSPASSSPVLPPNAANVPKTLASEFAEMDRLALTQYQATHEAEVSPFPPPNGPDGRFGLELTFTNHHMVEACRDEREADYGRAYEEALSAWLNCIRRDAPEAVITPDGKDAWDYTQVKVFLPQVGLTLFLHADDWVVEIGSSPVTSKELIQHEALLQKVIFDAAKEVGLAPHPRIGGGHLHLEFESHFKDFAGVGSGARLLRDLIVDLCNRPLLFMGALVLDFLNAPPLAILSESQQQAFADVISEFDALPAHEQTIETLKSNIVKRVYTKSFMQRDEFEFRYYINHQDKYQCINLLHKFTVEIRGIRPQNSAHALSKLATLLESRLNRLKHDAEEGKPRVQYHKLNLSHAASWSVDRLMEKYHVTLPQSEVRQSLVDFVRDAGMDITDFPFDEVWGDLPLVAYDPSSSDSTKESERAL